MVRRRRAFVLSRRESNAIWFKATDSAFSDPWGRKGVVAKINTFSVKLHIKMGVTQLRVTPILPCGFIILLSFCALFLCTLP